MCTGRFLLNCSYFKVLVFKHWIPTEMLSTVHVLSIPITVESVSYALLVTDGFNPLFWWIQFYFLVGPYIFLPFLPPANDI